MSRSARFGVTAEIAAAITSSLDVNEVLANVAHRVDTDLDAEQRDFEMQRAEREGSRLGLGMLDIDHFKRVNDTCGHAAGDAVLCEVVRRAQGALRPYDSFGRFGGEEFLVIVPGAGENELREVQERIRGAVGSTAIAVGEHRLTVTVSLGAATCAGEGAATCASEGADAFIARADGALYAAKQEGRDRVVFAIGGGGDCP
jgi:two-component system, cell cycle response regulator